MPSPATASGAEGTVLFLLARATGYLARRGVPTPRLDAELLLASALGVDRLTLYLRFDAQPPAPKVDLFRELVRQRGARIPAAYLTGKREFWSLEFEVTAEVLVPRPETETLVETALEMWPPGREQTGWFLDLGTGCGNLAVALACQWPRARLVAADVSAAALRLAARNAARHGVEERIRFVRGDWLSAFGGKGVFRGIISNPPYVETAEMERLAPEVQREPRLALDGGSDGLYFFRALAASAPAAIAEGGWLLAEVGAGQAAAVASLWEEAGLGDIAVRSDLAGTERVVAGRRV